MWMKNGERCYARWFLKDYAYRLKPTARKRPRLYNKGGLMDHNRGTQRQNVIKAGTISFDGSGIDCLVRKISDGGANLEVESQICAAKSVTKRERNRIWPAEFVLIVFRINEHLGAIRDQGEGH
jgi:hypothetical protein